MSENLTLFTDLVEIPVVVNDWDAALTMTKGLDKLTEGEQRLPIERKAAILLMAEYGAIAHRCCFPPKKVKLAVVVWGLTVHICPSMDGLNGVFIEPFDAQKFEVGVEITYQKLSDYNSFQARLDGWGFAAGMLTQRFGGEKC